MVYFVFLLRRLRVGGWVGGWGNEAIEWLMTYRPTHLLTCWLLLFPLLLLLLLVGRGRSFFVLGSG